MSSQCRALLPRTGVRSLAASHVVARHVWREPRPELTDGENGRRKELDSAAPAAAQTTQESKHDPAREQGHKDYIIQGIKVMLLLVVLAVLVVPVVLVVPATVMSVMVVAVVVLVAVVVAVVIGGGRWCGAGGRWCWWR